MNPFCFVIDGRPATKKNSNRVFGHRVLPSKAYVAYEKEFRKQLVELGRRVALPHFTGPVLVQAKYYLPDRAHWPDLTGLMQATADIMSDETGMVGGRRQTVRKWLLHDDKQIRSWDGTEIAGIDKEHPRAEIVIVPLDSTDEIDRLVTAKETKSSQGEQVSLEFRENRF